jgi:hypothetical protein
MTLQETLTQIAAEIDGIDVSGKADKVAGATAGNLASLDANGNLTNSGISKNNVALKQPAVSIQLTGDELPAYINSLNRFLTGSITITLIADQTTETPLTINGFCGQAAMNINFNGFTLKGGIRAYFNTVQISIRNGTISKVDTDSHYVYGNINILFENMVFNTGTATLKVYFNTNVTFTNCDFSTCRNLASRTGGGITIQGASTVLPNNSVSIGDNATLCITSNVPAGGNIVAAGGLVVDQRSGHLADTFLRALESGGEGGGEGGDYSTKADKVTNAVSGNFAGLDATGNLIDSGKKAADFAETEHTHDAGADITGILPISHGGTGAETAQAAQTALGIPDLLAKYLSTVAITAPAGAASSAAGVTEWNIWSINDWQAENPSFTVAHTATQPGSLTGNQAFCIPTNSTMAQGVAPAVVLKWTSLGWRIKLITFFVYRNAQEELSKFMIVVPPGAASVTNGGQISWGSNQTGLRITRLLTVPTSGYGIGGTTDSGNNIQCQYIDTTI